MTESQFYFPSKFGFLLSYNFTVSQKFFSSRPQKLGRQRSIVQKREI